MASPAVELSALRKAFGAVTALDGLCLTVGQGEIVLLAGGSGSGKSTCLRIVAGLVRPNGGKVDVLGGRPGSLAVRRRLGFLPQDPFLPEWMRAEELLELVADLHGVPGAARPGRIAQALDMVGLETVNGRRLRDHSGEQRQRLAVAQALINDPDLLVLDEPMAGMDPAGRADMLDLLEMLREHRKAVLVTTHTPSQIESIADRAVIIDAGRDLLTGRAAELLGASVEVELHATGFNRRILTQVRRHCEIRSVEQGRLLLSLVDRSRLPDVIAVLTSAGCRLDGVIERRPTLDDLLASQLEEE